MIIKVQQSLISSSNTKRMLVYNEDRSLFFEDELTPDAAKVLDNRPKAYFEAEIDEDGALSIIKEVDERNW